MSKPSEVGATVLASASESKSALPAGTHSAYQVEEKILLSMSLLRNSILAEALSASSSISLILTFSSPKPNDEPLSLPDKLVCLNLVKMKE